MSSGFVTKNSDELPVDPVVGHCQQAAGSEPQIGVQFVGDRRCPAQAADAALVHKRADDPIKLGHRRG